MRRRRRRRRLLRQRMRRRRRRRRCRRLLRQQLRKWKQLRLKGHTKDIIVDRCRPNYFEKKMAKSTLDALMAIWLFPKASTLSWNDVKLIDKQLKEIPMKVAPYKKGLAFGRTGWIDFAKKQGFDEGDLVIFQEIKNDTFNVFNVTALHKEGIMATNSFLERLPPKDLNHPPLEEQAGKGKQPLEEQAGEWEGKDTILDKKIDSLSEKIEIVKKMIEEKDTIRDKKIDSLAEKIEIVIKMLEEKRPE